MIRKIPALAYIEAQIIHQASAKGLLAPIARSVETRYGLELDYLGGGVFIQTRTLSLLYLLIVVPKESWKLDENHPIYGQISEAWSLNEVCIDICNSRWQNPIYRFIHHLRNAIAHANFEFKNENIEFWDQNKSKMVTYKATLSTTAMQKFLEVVGSLLANLKKEEST